MWRKIINMHFEIWEIHLLKEKSGKSRYRIQYGIGPTGSGFSRSVLFQINHPGHVQHHFHLKTIPNHHRSQQFHNPIFRLFAPHHYTRKMNSLLYIRLHLHLHPSRVLSRGYLRYLGIRSSAMVGPPKVSWLPIGFLRRSAEKTVYIQSSGLSPPFAISFFSPEQKCENDETSFIAYLNF